MIFTLLNYIIFLELELHSLLTLKKLFRSLRRSLYKRIHFIIFWLERTLNYYYLINFLSYLLFSRNKISVPRKSGKSICKLCLFLLILELIILLYRVLYDQLLALNYIFL